MSTFRKHIRDLHDGTSDGTRVFDAVIEDGVVYLEIKIGRGEYSAFLWTDVTYQGGCSCRNSRVKLK